MEGWGTDAYLHLKRVGDTDEPVPPTMFHHSAGAKISPASMKTPVL